MSSFQTTRNTNGHMDDFPTPPWATRALAKHHKLGQLLWEPASGRGVMATTLRELGHTVVTTPPDFLEITAPMADWIVTNPPYNLANKFIQHALKLCSNVAMLLRTAVLESKWRHEHIYKLNPPNRVLIFAERPGFFPEQVVDIGSGNSSCWLVWDETLTGTELSWIPPCKKELERPEDYEKPNLVKYPLWSKYFED